MVLDVFLGVGIVVVVMDVFVACWLFVTASHFGALPVHFLGTQTWCLLWCAIGFGCQSESGPILALTSFNRAAWSPDLQAHCPQEMCIQQCPAWSFPATAS